MYSQKERKQMKKILRNLLVTFLLVGIIVGLMKLISMISFNSIFQWLEGNWIGLLVGIGFSQVGFLISDKLSKIRRKKED